jgi:hypothetical protein
MTDRSIQAPAYRHQLAFIEPQKLTERPTQRIKIFMEAGSRARASTPGGAIDVPNWHVPDEPNPAG